MQPPPGFEHAMAMDTRAVLRSVDPGTVAECIHCGRPVKFQARAQARQVIANVYVSGAWDRVEHYHFECYGQAGEPYGAACS